MKEDDIKERIRQEPLLERLSKCRWMIGRMCSELRPPKMSIPVRWYDEDMYIDETLKQAMEMLSENVVATHD